MVGDTGKRGRPSDRGSADSRAETAGASTIIVSGLILGAVLVLAWLYWPLSVEKGEDPTAARVSGQATVETSRSTSVLGGTADALGAERSRIEAAMFQGAHSDSSAVADDAAPVPGKHGQSQEVSRSFAFAGAETTTGRPIASDDESDEDAEAQLQPISGWVLDQQGEPVSLIEVSASPRRLAQGQGASGAGGGEAAVVTDDAGYFAFSELPDGEYLLETEATEVFESARTIVRAGSSSAVLRVTGDIGKPVTIYGVVADEQGQPIAGARVAPTDEAQAATTDGAGNYSLRLTIDDRSRTRSLRFTREGYRAKTEAILQAHLQDAADYRLDASLEAAGGGIAVHGIVMSENLEPVGGARVRLTSQDSRRLYGATTSSDGSFTLDDVAIGVGYRLWVRPVAGFQDYVEDGLEVAGDGRDLAVYLEPLGTASLDGRMVNAIGEPVPGYTLWMWNGAAGANRNLAVTGKGDGTFRVDDVPAGEVVFDSQGDPRFSLGGIRLESGESTTAELVLDWGREELAGVVVDSNGAPVAGAEVTLLWSDEVRGVSSQSKRRTVTDAGGYFIFTELGPGLHTVLVSANGYRAVRREETPTMPGGEVLIQLLETAS